MTRLILIALSVSWSLSVPLLWAAPGSTDSSPLPAQRQNGYILGPEDTLLITARDVDEMPKSPVRVDLLGDIRLPLIGSVHAAGLTVPALEKVVTERLASLIVRPEVVINVAEFRSQPISILGAVRSPGVYQVQGRKTARGRQ
jgi:protein involved in polysaccharide export with SLBB domain